MTKLNQVEDKRYQLSTNRFLAVRVNYLTNIIPNIVKFTEGVTFSFRNCIFSEENYYD